MPTDVDPRDREITSLRSKLIDYQQQNYTMLRAVVARGEITINGVIYRPVN